MYLLCYIEIIVGDDVSSPARQKEMNEDGDDTSADTSGIQEESFSAMASDVNPPRTKGDMVLM